jgi:hypothetical protein
MRGRVDSEPEAGDPPPRGKRKILSILAVETLGDRREGLVGLMVGNGADGDFAGFKITPASGGK